MLQGMSNADWTESFKIPAVFSVCAASRLLLT